MIITQQAPDSSSLENLNKSNADLVDIVEAASKGTGPISFKVVGSRKQFSTENKRITNQVDVNISAEGIKIDEVETLIDKVFKVLGNGN